MFIIDREKDNVLKEFNGCDRFFRFMYVKGNIRVILVMVSKSHVARRINFT